jgi:hypothetical protein
LGFAPMMARPVDGVQLGRRALAVAGAELDAERRPRVELEQRLVDVRARLVSAERTSDAAIAAVDPGG